MKINDVIKVAIQPRNQSTSLSGERGYIEEISGDFATIQTLSVTGRGTGCGTVPLNCLELETSQIWRDAKTLYDAGRVRFEAEILAWQKQRADKVAQVAKAHGITPAQALEIYAALRNNS